MVSQVLSHVLPQAFIRIPNTHLSSLSLSYLTIPYSRGSGNSLSSATCPTPDLASLLCVGPVHKYSNQLRSVIGKATLAQVSLYIRVYSGLGVSCNVSSTQFNPQRSMAHLELTLDQASSRGIHHASEPKTVDLGEF